MVPVLPRCMRPFTDFVHGTHLSVASIVLQNGKISKKPVSDSTVLKSAHVEAVWFAPGPAGDDSYGPLTLHLSTLHLLKGKQ